MMKRILFVLGKHAQLLCCIALLLGLLSVIGVAATDTGGKIVVAIFAGPEADAHFRLSPLFEELTGIQVEIEELSRDIFRQKLMASLMGGTGEYDVVFIPHENVPEHYQAGTLQPLTPYLDRDDLYVGYLSPVNYDIGDFPAATLEWLSDGGDLYGLPQEVLTTYYHYRKDLFEQYGITPPPPTGYSWDEFLAVSEQLTKDLDGDGNTDLYGTAVAGQVSGTLAAFAIQNFWREGVELFDDEWNPFPDEEAAIEAVRLYRDLANSGVVPPGVPGGYQWSQLNIAMQENLVASALQWNSGSAAMENLEQSPDIAGKIGYAALPYNEVQGPMSSRSWSGVHGLYIPDSSQNKEAAFKYIAWFTSPEIARNTATQGGGSSGRKSVLQDPEVLALYPWYETFNDALALTGHAPPKIPELGYIMNPIVATNFEACLTGSKTPEECVRDMKEQMRSLMEGNGYYD